MEKEFGYEQGILPIGSAEAPVRDLASRNAFGRVVNLSYFSVQPEALAELEQADLERTEVDYLRSSLFRNSGPSVVDGVALNPSEYTALVRNPRAFGKAIVARTLHARGGDPNYERRLAAAGRSQQHAFEAKAEKLENMKKGLDQEATKLSRLLKEIGSPGYAHMSEASMRQLVGFIWQVTFKNMLYVASLQQKWGSETYARSDLALTKRLLTGGQRDKVRYWGSLTRLAYKYNRARSGLTRQRLAAVSRRAHPED